MVSAEIIEKRMKSCKSANQFYLLKMLALNTLSKLLGYNKQINPYKAGKLPYEKEIIEALFDVIYEPNLPSYRYVATAYLLDYYCPDWRLFVENKIIGRIVARGSKEVNLWVKAALLRDNNTCQDCGSQKNLHVHHIIPWSECLELRIDIDNGITLCDHCHGLQHDNYNFVTQGRYMI